MPELPFTLKAFAGPGECEPLFLTLHGLAGWGEGVWGGQMKASVVKTAGEPLQKAGLHLSEGKFALVAVGEDIATKNLKHFKRKEKKNLETKLL